MTLKTSGITLPRSVVTNILDKAKGVSTIAALSQAKPQIFADSTHLIFNPSSEAEVVAEGAAMGSYEQTLTPVAGKIVKLVTTTRVSKELVYADSDDRLQIVSAIQDDQLDALARALDYVVYHAVNPKSGAALSGYTALTDGAISVTAGSDQTANIDNLADALIDYNINGLALSPAWASALRKVRVSATGQRLYPEIPLNLNAGSVDGIAAKVSNTVNGAKCKTATGVMGIMGDFNLIKWGMVRDAKAEIIEYGDPDGSGVDLKNVGQIAYRTESILSYAVLDASGFAVLKAATV